MTLAARIALVGYSLLALFAAPFAGGCVYIFTNADPMQLYGVWTLCLIAALFNGTFAVLACMTASRPLAIVLGAAGLCYAALGPFVTWRTGNLDPKTGIPILWPAFPLKGAAAFATALLIHYWPGGS